MTEVFQRKKAGLVSKILLTKTTTQSSGRKYFSVQGISSSILVVSRGNG